MYLSYFAIKCCYFVTVNVAFFVIGIVLWLGGTSQYGQVINYETNEWNYGPVIDVVSVS